MFLSKFSTLFGILTINERRSCRNIIVLGALAAMIEMLGATSIMPFVFLLTSPESTELPEILRNLYDLVGLTESTEMITVTGLVAITVFFLALVLKLVVAIKSQKFLRSKEASLSVNLLRKYISADYLTITARSNADYGRLMLKEANRVVNAGIASMLTIAVQASTCLFIICGIIYLNPIVGVVTVSFAATAFGFISIYQRKPLAVVSRGLSALNRKCYDTFLEIFGGIREIKIYAIENIFLSKYVDQMRQYRDLVIKSTILIQATRIALEALTFGGIISLALYLFITNPHSRVLPVLAFYAYAAYRIFPASVQIYTANTALEIGWTGITDTVRDLDSIDQETHMITGHGPEPVIKRDFAHVSVKNLRFKYSDEGNEILRGFSLDFIRGEVIALVGNTGSGKSTFLDILFGLARQKSGQIFVDQYELNSKENYKAWHQTIAYVSQRTRLFSDSIERNITLGRRGECHDRALGDSVKIALLADWLTNELPDGIATKIGDDGVEVSGGQAQRIGIARALYGGPQIIVLDEATNSLDLHHATTIIDSLQKNGKTLIVVTHQPEIMKICNSVIHMKDGVVHERGSFPDLINRSEDFRRLIGSIK